MPRARGGPRECPRLSNRGPATFERDESGRARRRAAGGGGLVTALTGLLRQRDALWIASAMTEEDVEVSRAHGERGFEVEVDGIPYRIRLVASDPDAYDRFYNQIANPLLWFIQHYLWDLSNVPDIRLEEREAWEHGYKRVNDDLARAVLEEIEDLAEPVVMIHDYHLYTCPGADPGARARTPSCTTSSTSPGPSPTPGACCPTDIRTEIFEGLLANDIIGFHTRSYCNNFLQCCRELMDLDTDFERGAVLQDGHETWVRAYPLPIDAEGLARDRRERGRRWSTSRRSCAGGAST